MKGLKNIGLIMFLGGFCLFLASFFIGSFTLYRDVLKEAVTEKQFKLLDEKAYILYGETFSNSFGFVKALNKSLREVNQDQLNKYAFTQKELEKIVTLNQEQFKLSTLSEVFPDSEAGNYKKKAFSEYGGWLENKKFSDPSESIVLITQVARSVERYAIINDKGIDRYAEKDLAFILTRNSSNGLIANNRGLALSLIYGLCIIGGLLYIFPVYSSNKTDIKNDGVFRSSLKNKGWLGIMLGTFLIAFYIFLYFYPEHMTPWVIMTDPLSKFLNGNIAGQFFLYGFLYTICVVVMGIRMILKYRHSKYHLVRTFSVMFFQLAFAFLIPEILIRLNQPYFDFKNIWPLDYDFFFDSELSKLIQSGGLGIFMLFWGILLALIGVPLLTYFYGKRWYCSWVCGCGGLAETFGDPYRQLSDKSLKAWKVERWTVHGVLVFSIAMTAGVLYTYFTGSGNILGINTYSLREVYGLWIGAGFAGVVGTGFYPLMGNRVWCRFGCPLAAYLGIMQRFKSRFRITTNGGQCISCGNCSTYCEMGIDVRWYAQRGQNVVRSSCVGCGVCASVCPRGVLKLENGSESGRFNKPIEVGENGLILKA